VIFGDMGHFFWIFVIFGFLDFFSEHAGVHVPGAGGGWFMGRIRCFGAQNDAQEREFA
jgi:hypothetical protein